MGKGTRIREEEKNNVVSLEDARNKMKTKQKMETIKPIKELISFRMDEDGIWWLDYDWSGCSGSISRKQYREYDGKITYFLKEDNNFTILPESYYVNSPHPYLPFIIFPKVILEEYDYEITQFGFMKSYPNQGHPSPYYGNPHYKKYIEDNNGECPLPLPKDVKWGEV